MSVEIGGSARDNQELSAPFAIPPRPSKQAASPYVYASPPLGLSARSCHSRFDRDIPQPVARRVAWDRTFGPDRLYLPAQSWNWSRKLPDEHLLSRKRWPREGWHMNWPVAAVLIAVVFAIMVVVSTYVARPKR